MNLSFLLIRILKFISIRCFLLGALFLMTVYTLTYILVECSVPMPWSSCYLFIRHQIWIICMFCPNVFTNEIFIQSDNSFWGGIFVVVVVVIECRLKIKEILLWQQNIEYFYYCIFNTSQQSLKSFCDFGHSGSLFISLSLRSLSLANIPRLF